MGLRGFTNITYVPDREAFFEQLCRDKIVLHLGCADAMHLEEHIKIGRHLHARLSKVTRRLYGVDYDAGAIARLKSLQFSNLYVADVESLNLEISEDIDIILAGELIEHLNNPGSFLNGIRKLMTPDTELVISTPNLLSIKIFIHSLIGKQRIHPDHCLGFTFSLLETLLVRHGLVPVQWYSTIERFGSPRNIVANKVLSIFFRFLPRYADTIILINLEIVFR